MRIRPFLLAVSTLAMAIGVSPPLPAQPIASESHPQVLGKANPVAAGLPEQRFSLQAAQDAMQAHHPLLKAARASLSAAAADTVTAGLWTNPTLDASYAKSAFHPQNDPVGSVGVGLTQLIETARLPAARRQVADLSEQAAASDLTMVRMALQLDVESACLALAAAAAQVQVHADSIAELERAHQIVTARVRGGAAPEYDATRIGIALAQSQAALTEARAALTQARGFFDMAVGPGAADLPGLPSVDLFAVLTPTDVGAALDQARRTRPDLRSAELRSQAAAAQVQVARRQVFQGINVRAGMYFGTTPGELGATVGVGVPLPVIDRGQGSVTAALARSEAAAATQASLDLQAEQLIRATWREAVTRQEAFAAYVQAGATRSKGMVQEAEAGYRAGKLSVLELVDAYLAKRDARTRAVDLAHQARQAELRLRRAVVAGTSVFAAP